MKQERLETILDKNEKVCPICGKVFYNFVKYEWAYKEFDDNWDMRYMCSYSCMMKYREKILPIRVSHRKRVAKTKIKLG